MMTNTEVVKQLKTKTGEESRLLIEILNLLELVRARRIYNDYGYSSLFEFCTKELKYSEGAAMRRINALTLQTQSPEIKKMIHENLENGELNLSHISAIAKIERSEELSIDQIKLAIEASQGTSARETEKVIRQTLNLKPVSVKTKVSIELSSEQLAHAEKLAALFSHSLSTQDLPGLFLYLLEKTVTQETNREAAQKLRKSLGRKVKIPDPQTITTTDKPQKLLQNMALIRNSTAVLKQSPPTSAVKIPTNESDHTQIEAILIHSKMRPIHSRTFSPLIRKKIRDRSQGMCEFISPITQKRCKSRWYLQLDHIHPWSLGGSSTLENCRMVCASHNRSEWIRIIEERQAELRST